MTFELVDLEELGEKALVDFNQAVGQPNSSSAEAFEVAVTSLVTKIEFTYSVAAKLAHREPNLEGTAATWTKMVAICDQIASRVKQLEREHAGSRASIDRMLELRNAAERRRDLVS